MPSVDPDDAYLNLAQAVRTIRESRNQSLRATARIAGVTPSLISQIETGRVKPSVDTLFALARALNVPAADFFNVAGHAASPDDSGRASFRVVRRSSRRQLRLGSGVVWESLTEVPWPRVRLVEISYPPGGKSADHAFGHGGRDFAYVLEGRLTLNLDGTVRTLDVGDSVWYDSHLPHQYSNHTESTTRFLALTIDPWALEADPSAP